jgi:cyclopropane fatty-acyl-phospholipid synthase-like methyltransferase
MAGRLAAARPGTVLDVGCGWAELLLRLVARVPEAAAVGIDTDERVLARGRAAAHERGLADRVTLRNAPGDQAHGPADLVICVGSSHAFGDQPATALASLRGLVRPGGRLLFGEAYWEPTGPVTTEHVWPDMLTLPSLAGLVDLAVAAGFRPLWTETANPDEWAAFESGYLADLEEWLLTHRHHPDALKHGAEADEHRTRWLHGYRGGLGFAYLTLGRPLD